MGFDAFNMFKGRELCFVNGGLLGVMPEICCIEWCDSAPTECNRNGGICTLLLIVCILNIVVERICSKFGIQLRDQYKNLFLLPTAANNLLQELSQ